MNNNKDFSTTMIVDATPQTVFAAINNIRGWWSENIDGATDRLNSEFAYHYQDVHRCRMHITELVPGQKVVWHVNDNYFKFIEDEKEWKDTDIIFELSEKDGGTQLTFTHKGLVPEYECFKVCHDAWTHYIQDSLKNLILTGKGNPTPADTGTAPAVQQSAAEQTGTKSIYHRLLILAPVEKVYEALTTQKGLAGWWTPDTTAQPETGSIARFAFGPEYFKEMRIEELSPYSKVKWQCIQGYEDWVGTTLTFELEPHPKGCILSFRHEGFAEYTAGFASCSYDWALFFRSLKFLCETGKGFPYPDFNK